MLTISQDLSQLSMLNKSFDTILALTGSRCAKCDHNLTYRPKLWMVSLLNVLYIETYLARDKASLFLHTNCYFGISEIVFDIITQIIVISVRHNIDFTFFNSYGRTIFVMVNISQSLFTILIHVPCLEIIEFVNHVS